MVYKGKIWRGNIFHIVLHTIIRGGVAVSVRLGCWNQKPTDRAAQKQQTPCSQFWRLEVEIRVSAWWVASVLGVLAFPGVHSWRKGLCGVSLIRSLIPHLRAPPPPPKRPTFSHCHLWGLGFQHVNLGEHKHSDHSNCQPIKAFYTVTTRFPFRVLKNNKPMSV